MHPARARLIHNRPQQDGPVLYWMHRELRAHDNWALLHAQELAQQRGQPLAVAFCLARHYPLAALPHFAFMLHGLRETASTLAALDGRAEVACEDVDKAASLALPHRMRRNPFESVGGQSA